MNTLRFKPEYSDQAIELLKNAPMGVYPSTEIFLEIGREFEGEPNAEKLNKLFKKAYTVMAVEDGKLIGLAGMDKEGYIGIFAADDAKARKLLLNALDRRASKTEIPQLFVQPTEENRAVFINQGFEPMNEGDDFCLIKKTAFKERSGIKIEDVKEYSLDPKKAITVEGKHSVFPFFYFATNCFFMFLLITLSVTEHKDIVADTNHLIVYVVFTLLFLSSLTILIWYFIRRARLKKQVLSMRVTNGVITSFATLLTRNRDDGHFATPINYPEYTRVFITYEFYDENMQKRTEKYTHRYRFSGPYFYEGQKLVIACSQEKSYILHKYTILNPSEEEEEEIDLSKISVTSKRLVEFVPIKATKMYYGHALSYLCGLGVTFLLYVILSILEANSAARPIFKVLFENFLFWLPFFVIFLAFSLYTFSITMIEKRKYRKLLASPDVQCTVGKIVHRDKTFRSDNKMRFYCQFNDGKEKRSVKVPYRSSSNLVKWGKTKVLVVYNRTEAVVLVKRGEYPDKFVFKYYRN